MKNVPVDSFYGAFFGDDRRQKCRDVSFVGSLYL